MFTVAGVSQKSGVHKVRFANDMVTRVKNLIKDGQADINLITLPNAMEKGEAVKYLMSQESLVAKPEWRAAIETADAKYNHTKIIRIAGVKVKTSVSTPEVVAG